MRSHEQLEALRERARELADRDREWMNDFIWALLQRTEIEPVGETPRRRPRVLRGKLGGTS